MTYISTVLNNFRTATTRNERAIQNAAKDSGEASDLVLTKDDISKLSLEQMEDYFSKTDESSVRIASDSVVTKMDRIKARKWEKLGAVVAGAVTVGLGAATLALSGPAGWFVGGLTALSAMATGGFAIGPDSGVANYSPEDAVNASNELVGSVSKQDAQVILEQRKHALESLQEVQPNARAADIYRPENEWLFS